MDKLVILAIENDVATITLNRPERHNSFVPELLTALLTTLELCTDREDVRIIVLGARGASFSTGGDLQGFYENRSDIVAYARNLVGTLNEVMCRILECPKPVVAVVDGQVTGGALGLVVSADVVVATENASFAPYYVDVGFSPDGGWTAILPLIIGRTRASSVQQLNSTITAGQALDWGLVTRLTSTGEIDRSLAELCNCLRAKVPGSQANTRILLRPCDYRERLERERELFLEQIASDEALVALASFTAT